MQLFINGLIAGSLGALIAGGLALVYGMLGVFNLALGQTVLIGGYTTWWLYQVVELHLVFSVLGGCVSGGGIGYLTYLLFVQPFYKYHRYLPLVTTIALSMILDALILIVFKERVRSIFPGVKDTFELFGARVSAEHIVLIILTMLILFVSAYVLHATRFGRQIRAVVQHDSAAYSLGIPAKALHLLLFVLSGVLAASGGIYIGIDQNLTPTLAFPLTIKAYAAIIAGGRGNFWGAIFCAYLIAFLEQYAIGVHWFGAYYVPAGYQQTVALLFIIIFLLWKPDGLFSSSTRKA